MKKKKWIVAMIIWVGLWMTAPHQTYAYAPDCGKNSYIGPSFQYQISPNEFRADSISSINVELSFTSDDAPNGKYRITSVGDRIRWGTDEQSAWVTKGDTLDERTYLNFSLSNPKSLGTAFNNPPNIGIHYVYLAIDTKDANRWCTIGTYTILPKEPKEEKKDDFNSDCTFEIFQNRDEQQCFIGGEQSCTEMSDERNLHIKVSGLKKNNSPYAGKVVFQINQTPDFAATTSPPGTAVAAIIPRKKGSYSVKMKTELRKGNAEFANCSTSFEVTGNCPINQCDAASINIVGRSTSEISTSGTTDTPQFFDLCAQAGEEGSQRYKNCMKCYTALDEDQHALWTSIGCIETTTEGIVSKLMKVGLSIAGGIALLMILAAAFILATSEGEPKRTSEAKEILTNAMIGLVFVIFSITILQFIGVTIFRLPEFGG